MNLNINGCSIYRNFFKQKIFQALRFYIKIQLSYHNLKKSCAIAAFKNSLRRIFEIFFRKCCRQKTLTEALSIDQSFYLQLLQKLESEVADTQIFINKVVATEFLYFNKLHNQNREVN